MKIHQEHRVFFYGSDEEASETAADFLIQGLKQGEDAVVIARAVLYKKIVPRLIRLGLNVPAEAGPRLFMFDAQQFLSQFMSGEYPDAELFHRRLKDILRPVGSRLRAFGEMVDILVSEGKVNAAIRLEELWNEALSARPFSLLCGYAKNEFEKDSKSQELEKICGQHSHVRGKLTKNLHLISLNPLSTSPIF